MTKLEFEKKKRWRMLSVTAILSVLITIALSTLQVGGDKSTWIVGGVTVALCLLVLICVIRYLAATIDYRMIKDEFVRYDGQTPHSTTYYVAQKRVLWWIDCRDRKGTLIRSRNRRIIDKYIDDKINDWLTQIPSAS